MLHDDFKEHLLKMQHILKFSGARIQSENCDLGSDVIDATLKANPVPIYMDNIEFNHELLSTALAFLDEGVLQAPRADVLYFFRHCTVNTDLLKDEENPESCKDNLQMQQLAVYANDFDAETLLLMVYAQEEAAEHTAKVMGARIIWVPHYAATFNKVTKRVHIRGFVKDIPSDESEIASFLVNIVLQAMLVIGMPHFERKDSGPISEKLNKARVERGRPVLTPYITINYSKQVLDYLGGTGTGGWKVKPHWRRGHIRTYADGKRVPIPATLVNFKGGALPDQKPYRMKGQNA